MSTGSNTAIRRYVCSRCGADCSGYCSIGHSVVCAECFKTAVLYYLANQVTSSGI